MVRESDSSLWLNRGFKIAPPTRRYNTRLHSRIVMEEQAAEIEQLKKTNEDLQKQLDQMAEMVASMRQQNMENSGNNSNGQSSQSTLPHGLPTAQPTNASLSPPALNIPLQENQTQIPQPTTNTFTFPPPPPGVYPFTPSMFTTSGGIPTTQPIPPPTYTMPPPAPRHTPNNPLFVPDEQFEREIGGAESQRVLS